MLLFISVFWIAGVARADFGSPSLNWKGWSLRSNEQIGGEFGAQPVFPYRFSFANLIDGNPATTWVYNDTIPQTKSRALKKKREARSFTLSPGKPVLVDEIRLMNGYNKSRRSFAANDRVIEIELWVNRRKLKRVRLADMMGWHKISIPRQKIDALEVRLVGICKGTSADSNIGLSEVALYAHDKRIDFRAPRAFVYVVAQWIGAGTIYVIDKNGMLLAQGESSEGTSCEFNAMGDLVAGLGDVQDKKISVWVVSLKKARLVWQREIDSSGSPSLHWTNRRTLQLRYHDSSDYAHIVARRNFNIG